jgi:hypothetical protein
MLSLGGASGTSATFCMCARVLLGREVSVFRKSLLASQDDDMLCDSIDGLDFGCRCTDDSGEIDEVDLVEALDEHEPRRSSLEFEFIVADALLLQFAIIMYPSLADLQ